jgi:hypothetical protein
MLTKCYNGCLFLSRGNSMTLTPIRTCKQTIQINVNSCYKKMWTLHEVSLEDSTKDFRMPIISIHAMRILSRDTQLYYPESVLLLTWIRDDKSMLCSLLPFQKKIFPRRWYRSLNGSVLFVIFEWCTACTDINLWMAMYCLYWYRSLNGCALTVCFIFVWCCVKT